MAPYSSFRKLLDFPFLEFVRSCFGTRPSYVEKAMRIAIASLLLAMTLRLGAAVGIMPAAAQTFTEFILPTAASRPSAITTGPDGALWFTESVSGKIGRITTDGKITEFALPNPHAQPWGITTGPDGALWFTEASCIREPGSRCIVGNKIGRITTTGLVTEFTIPSDGSGPHSITTGPDGALWFTEYYGSRVGRLVLP